MKKFLLPVLVVCLLSSVYPVQIKAGMMLGSRSLADSEMGDLFGADLSFYPYLGLVPVKGLTIGMGCDTRYDRVADLGIYQDKANLTITGLNIFLGYEREIVKGFFPYFKIGYGHVRVKNTFENPGMSQYDFSFKKGGIFISGGAAVKILRTFRLLAEARYIRLKYTPFEEEFDFGGWICSTGLEYAFDI